MRYHCQAKNSIITKVSIEHTALSLLKFSDWFKSSSNVLVYILQALTCSRKKTSMDGIFLITTDTIYSSNFPKCLVIIFLIRRLSAFLKRKIVNFLKASADRSVLFVCVRIRNYSA